MVSKGDTLKMMKERNPKEFSKLKKAMLSKQPVREQPVEEQGFIDMDNNREVV